MIDLKILQDICSEYLAEEAYLMNTKECRTTLHNIVQSITPESREILGKKAATKISNNTSFQYSNDVLSREQIDLQRAGITQLFQRDYDVLQHFKERQVFNRHVWKISDNIPRSRLESQKTFPQACHSLNDVTECPSLLELVTSDYILNIVESYLGCVPTLYSLNAMWSFPTKEHYVGTQHFHRDLDNLRSLTLFIFLTDVDQINGGHEYYPESHIKRPFTPPLAFHGKSGTAFISDPFGLHRGCPVIDGERLIFWARYGLYDNGYSTDITPERLDYSLIKNRINDTEKMRYILRPLFQTEFSGDFISF